MPSGKRLQFLWKITIFHGEIIQLNGHGFNSYDVAMDVFDFGTVPVPRPGFFVRLSRARPLATRKLRRAITTGASSGVPPVTSRDRDFGKGLVYYVPSAQNGIDLINAMNWIVVNTISIIPSLYWTPYTNHSKEKDIGGFRSHGGIPKWMVYHEKSHQNGWFRGTTIYGNPHLPSAQNGIANSWQL